MVKDSGLHVNFSSEEMESEAISYDAIPSGKYYCRITEGELKATGASSKVEGRPYWSLTLTIQDGAFARRKLFANVMLFDGALYSLAQLMKACGFEKEMKSGNIPDLSAFLGKEVIVTVARVSDTYKMNKLKEEDAWDGEILFKNEVKGFSKYDGKSPSESTAGAKGNGSLLP